MRNPDRLDGFYEELKEIHKKSFPDWRFSQLISNIAFWLGSEKKVDMFYLEETPMMILIREYEEKYGRK